MSKKVSWKGNGTTAERIHGGWETQKTTAFCAIDPFGSLWMTLSFVPAFKYKNQIHRIAEETNPIPVIIKKKFLTH